MRVLWIWSVLYVWGLAAISNPAMLARIAAEANTTAPYSFAVMGDSRDGNAVLAALIRSLNADTTIRFSLNNGDLVPHGKRDEFTEYARIIAQAKRPLLNIIGNHDAYASAGKANYRTWFGEPYFSFTYANSYFIITDNADLMGFDSRQWRWLTRELEKSRRYAHRFVFMHVPLYDPRKGHYARGHSLRSLRAAHRINDLLDRYDITMLFASHIHAYYRGMWHRTPYIITGGAGAPLKSRGFYHYVKVTVDEGKVEYEVVRVAL